MKKVRVMQIAIISLAMMGLALRRPQRARRRG